MRKRKWALVIVAVCVIVTVAAVAYAAGVAKTAAPEVIRAQRFELVDAEGRVRAVLGESPGGAPALMLNDEKGQARAALGLDANCPRLELSDEQGEARASLFLVFPSAVPSLWLRDEKGKVRASLEVAPGGSRELAALGPGLGFGAELVLRDEEGRRIWSAP